MTKEEEIKKLIIEEERSSHVVIMKELHHLIESIEHERNKRLNQSVALRIFELIGRAEDLQRDIEKGKVEDIIMYDFIKDYDSVREDIQGTIGNGNMEKLFPRRDTKSEKEKFCVILRTISSQLLQMFMYVTRLL